MNKEIKDEALEQLEIDIKAGFEKPGELFDNIRDMFYDEENFDEDWLRQTIEEKYSLHQKESLNWQRPTGFDKLAVTFDELINEKIVCLHKAGFTKQDGENDCMETIEELNKVGIKAIGYCYYHSQDLARAVDAEENNLYLGFDSPGRDDAAALKIANKIVEQFRKNGFEVSWPGTVDKRIEIKNVDWKKIPDDEEWGSDRVIKMLTSKTKKPFWKFW